MVEVAVKSQKDTCRFESCRHDSFQRENSRTEKLQALKELLPRVYIVRFGRQFQTGKNEKVVQGGCSHHEDLVVFEIRRIKEKY
jgi:uncharacterized repeat protein (TIGR04076 family)